MDQAVEVDNVALRRTTNESTAAMIALEQTGGDDLLSSRLRRISPIRKLSLS